MQISIRIDNKKVRCAKGKTILNVARGCGISIPTLCSHEALLPYGACRLCIVEVAHRGICRIVASCTTTVQDGMRILTQSRRILSLRKTLVGLLASHCPDAPVVQRLAKDLGAAPMPPAPPADLCIRCGLCVRFCSEVVG
ncbi:MAG: 2Fe-2S iron-sulfur cluster-binding protein, partial [Desulfobacterota bacterium]|nr:2Fe-2S iron-sulfur cluster-binding protein [Thermodesulfobacteriota bacterium]